MTVLAASGVVLMAYLAAYFPALRLWVGDTLRDPNYGHAVPLSLGLLALGLWRSRQSSPRGTWMVSGGALLALAMPLGVLGILGSEAFTLRVSGILAAAAAVSMLASPRRAGVWQPIVLAHLFLVPWPYVVFYATTARLQRISSAVAGEALSVSGIPLVREGNMLRLPGYQLEVVEACSGLRGILTLTALAACIAVFAGAKGMRLVWLVALALPLALLANFLRLVGTGFAAQLVGPETADRVFHIAGGMGTFALGTIVLSSVAFAGRRQS